MKGKLKIIITSVNDGNGNCLCRGRVSQHCDDEDAVNQMLTASIASAKCLESFFDRKGNDIPLNAFERHIDGIGKFKDMVDELYEKARLKAEQRKYILGE